MSFFINPNSFPIFTLALDIKSKKLLGIPQTKKIESPSSSEYLFLISSVFSSPIFLAIGPDPFPSLKNMYPSPGCPSSIAHLFILSQKALDPPSLEGIAQTLVLSFLDI